MSASRRIFLIWVVALAAVLFILLHESLILGKGLVPADGILNYLPWNKTSPPSNYLLKDQYCDFIPLHHFVYQQILRGIFPLWNPNLGCGMPNLGSIQGSLLFPIQLLFSPIDPFYASGWAAFLKLFLAGFFTMLYLRQLEVCDAAAFLSGLIFSFSGFMILWLGHPHVNCAMWFPLLLYFMEKSFRSTGEPNANLSASRNIRAWMGFSVAFGLMILGGHPPTAIHIAIGVTIYFLFRQLKQGEKIKIILFQRSAFFVCAVIVGLLLAAPQILPFLEYYLLSSTSLTSVNLQRWTIHLEPTALIHFLLPYVSGSPSKGFERLPRLLGFFQRTNFNERTGYVGILPLFLALFAVTYRRCGFTVFYSCVALVSLLIVYGVRPLPELVRVLPIFSDINQTRLLMFVGFSVAVLAGLGWDTLSRMENRRKALWVVAAFWLLVALPLLFYWKLIRARYAGLDEMHRTFLMAQLPVLAFGLFASAFILLCRESWGRRLPTLICLGCVVIDLLQFGMRCNPSISRESYYPATGAIKWLQEDTSVFRVMGVGSVLVPNTAEVFGLSDARGCDFMSVRRYEELITDHAGNFYFYDFVPSLPKPFQLLNVKYVLLPKNLSFLNPQLFDRVYSDEIDIYRYKAWRERALLVSDYQVDHDPRSILARVRSGNFDPSQILLLENEPVQQHDQHDQNDQDHPENTETATSGSASSVRVTSYEPDEVKLEASLTRSRFLLFLDTWFPGWSATVNGRNVPIYRADYNFRAISLPPGKSTVCFSYRPVGLQIGLALFAAGVLALGAAWFWSR